jgi:16S rRNA U1498 N3-methylase RsmE
MKEFILNGLRVKAGDEVKVVTKEKEKYNGIVIGAKKRDKSIMMVTHRDEIKFFEIDNILKFKIKSKYGKFFN